MTSKETSLTIGGEVTERVDYTYNLQNRLETVTTTPYISGVADPANAGVTVYTYNAQGIRVSKDVDGVVTSYLIDPSNHTGYAQVLEETTDDGTTTHTRIQYTLGDDVISQNESTSTDSGANWTAGDTEYLLYDGHGSTRQLADPSGTVAAADNYSYDAYGVMLSDGSGADAAANAGTKMLYAGEQYDSAASMYYNRARYYNPSNGRFNRTDPYAGNSQDPQSLHKYAYCHANPVNGIDPTGMFSVLEVTVALSISMLITAFNASVFVYIAKRIIPVIRALEDLSVELRMVNPAGADKVEQGIKQLKAGLKKHVYTSALLAVAPIGAVVLYPAIAAVGSVLAIGGSSVINLDRLHGIYKQIVYVVNLLQKGLTFDNGSVFGYFGGTLNMERSVNLLAYQPKLLAKHIEVITGAIRNFNAGDMDGFKESYWTFGRKVGLWGDFCGIIGKRSSFIGVSFYYGIGFTTNPFKKLYFAGGEF